jgi:hypothetical protein
VFHVELRKFPNVARALNLTALELHERIVGPWVRNEVIELEDRRWAPEQAKLTIYEGPELPTDQIGLGRGWANATRSGEEVTDRVLSEARDAAGASLAELRQELLQRCVSSAVSVQELVTIANERFPQLRVSDRLALAEQCVWELLHQGRLRLLVLGGEPEIVEREQWESTLLAWETWSSAGARVLIAGNDDDA